MKIAIVGGGINGLMAAYFLSKKGHSIDIFDKSNILSETSSKSSKLLHGGIRYLEQGHIPFVYKALIDRYWWKLNAPDLCKTIEIVCPVYRNSPRGKFKMFFGAKMYEFF